MAVGHLHLLDLVLCCPELETKGTVTLCGQKKASNLFHLWETGVLLIVTAMDGAPAMERPPSSRLKQCAENCLNQTHDVSKLQNLIPSEIKPKIHFYLLLYKKSQWQPLCRSKASMGQAAHDVFTRSSWIWLFRDKDLTM